MLNIKQHNTNFVSTKWMSYHVEWKTVHVTTMHQVICRWVGDGSATSGDGSWFGDGTKNWWQTRLASLFFYLVSLSLDANDQFLPDRFHLCAIAGLPMSWRELPEPCFWRQSLFVVPRISPPCLVAMSSWLWRVRLFVWPFATEVSCSGKATSVGG